MATVVSISERAKADADDLVRQGRFGSVEQAIEAGLQTLISELTASRHDTESPDWIANVRAKIEEGRAQVSRGDVLSADQLFEPVLDRLRR